MIETNQNGTMRNSSLDISREAMAELAAQACSLVIDYFSRVKDLPVFPPTSGGQTLAHVGSNLPLEGEPLEKIIADCRTMIEGSRQNGHPRFFGYVASPATAPGAFAELIAGALNSNITCWRSAPAGTEIERLVVNWLSTLVGYGDNVQGLLTSGGSMANLIALLVAHRTKSSANIAGQGIHADSAPMTIYASDQIHLSIPKAADILGLGRNQVRLVKSDERMRIDLKVLRKLIEGDQKAGLHPFCVVGSAGTVNTGAIDPLAELATVAKDFNLWFHIDGAYGALGALDKTKTTLFDGLERADSLALDPHKWLYVPVTAGCLLFREPAAARAAFGAGDADYIRVFNDAVEQEAFAFWDYGVELSRPFRALKIWLTLRYYGARRLAEAISDDNALAQHMARQIEQSDDFELLAPVELSICCFRHVPVSLNLRLQSMPEAEREQTLDQLNTRLMSLVQRGGQAYLSNATVNGRFALRACITNFRTTAADIDTTLAIIRAIAEPLVAEMNVETYE